MCVLRVAVAWSDVSVFFLRDGEDCARSSGAALHCLPTRAGDPREEVGEAVADANDQSGCAHAQL